jgi:hypothetical protein
VKKPSTKWHAVTVVLHTTSCAAATLCRNQRFLATGAPALPLPDCDHAATCPCTYKHHEDRRSGVRRTDDLRRETKAETETVERNRRTARGRRAIDHR